MIIINAVMGSSYQIWLPYGIPGKSLLIYLFIYSFIYLFIDVFIYKAFISNLTSGLTPDDPYRTLDKINVFHSGQGFFLPNLVAIGHL